LNYNTTTMDTTGPCALLPHSSELQIPEGFISSSFRDRFAKVGVELPENGTSYWAFVESQLSKTFTSENLQELCATIVSFQVLTQWVFVHTRNNLTPKRDTFPHEYNTKGLEMIIRSCSEEEQQRFFESTLPFMQRLALDLPNQFPDSVPLMLQNQEAEVSLTPRQCACLVASAFFCITLNQYYNEMDFPLFTFNGIIPPLSRLSKKPGEIQDDEEESNERIAYACMYDPSKKFGKYGRQVAEKVRSLLHYFNRLIENEDDENFGRGDRLVKFKRVVISEFPDWENSDVVIPQDSLVDVVGGFDPEAKIEESSPEFAWTNFANKYLGGGVLHRGCIQEQILMMICPEMMVGMQFIAMMLDNESLTISGLERFSNYGGYAASYKWVSDFREDKVVEKEVIAIDAIDFSDFEEDEEGQWSKHYIFRELNKAYAGFYGCTKPGIASGNWGCGAFEGDPSLKAIMQLIAASATKKQLRYCFFEQKKLVDLFQEVHKQLVEKGVTLGALMNFVLSVDPEQQLDEETTLLHLIGQHFA